MSHRCVLLFSRPASAEGIAKGIPRAEPLFEETRRRLARTSAALGADLVVLGPADQRGETFGERLANAFVDARSLGYTRTVMVPGDVPALDAGDLAAAFAALETGAVAIGPSPDGGVYLLGTASDPSALLGDVRWLTGHVAADLVRAVLRAGLRPTLLRSLTDVDGRRSLVALLHDPSLDPVLHALVRALLAPVALELEIPVDAAATAARRGEVSPRGPPVAA